MATLGRRRAPRQVDYWPGFVDALSTLLLAIIFILSVFVMGQFFLSQELTGRDTALQRLTRQIADLTDLLALERNNRRSAEDALGLASATLATSQAERDRLQALMESGAGAAQDTNQRATTLQGQIEAEKQITARAQSQVDLLNQQMAALRRQLAALEEALQASETRDRESQTRISDLGSRLNVALAQRVQELNRFRSEFFGRLRSILGNRQDIRVVGDRFVFQSELFFDVGQAVLKPESLPELDKLATAVIDLEREIPSDLPWVLRVDGHTDARPISTAQFRSNWDLSAARAIAVVQYLASKGVSRQHLAATGFAEFQPLELGDSEEAHRRNRRIEFKLTER